MTRKDKLFHKVKNNPRNVSFEAYYMSLNYPMQLERVPEGFCAYVPLLKGCKAFGETPDIACRELDAVEVRCVPSS